MAVLRPPCHVRVSAGGQGQTKASLSWSARPGEGKALRGGPEETEGGASPGSVSLCCLSLNTQLLEAGVSPLSFSARPTVSVLAVLRKYVLNK